MRTIYLFLKEDLRINFLKLLRNLYYCDTGLYSLK